MLRALLEKLGKLPAGGAGAAAKTAEQWEREFHDANIQFGTEREQLTLKIKKLENDVQRGQDSVRAEIFQDMRAQYMSPGLPKASASGSVSKRKLNR